MENAARKFSRLCARWTILQIFSKHTLLT
jgi:hypothetical protein